MSNQTRHPAGAPIGGQFAAQNRPPARIDLHDASAVPEVMVDVQWQVWDDHDRAIDTDSTSFDLGAFIAETDPAERITEFGDPTSPGALDHYVELAQERGLIEKRRRTVLRPKRRPGGSGAAR